MQRRLTIQTGPLETEPVHLERVVEVHEGALQVQLLPVVQLQIFLQLPEQQV